MRTIFDPRELQALRRRCSSLTADRRPRWGRLTAHQMVGHLAECLRVSLDDPPLAPPAGPFARFPLNWLVIHVLPWPQGKLQSPPDFLGFALSTWDADLRALGALLERASARGPGGPWAPSPAFGAISGRSWGALLRKHVDHHLRQFSA
jgi:hypothetical protein